jgi:predicted transcriptional regulator
MVKKTSYNGPTYTHIPNKAIEDLVNKGLTSTDMMVYVILCKHYNPEPSNCWPSTNTIAKAAGCSPRNATRSINSLCQSGMILKIKSKQANSVFENNTYYLPHQVSFELERLSAQKKTPKINKRMKQLLELKNYLLETIQKQIGTDKLSVRTAKLSERTDKKAGGADKMSGGVVSTSPTNNTTINNTINIIKNVKENKAESNENLPLGFKSIKRYDNEFSKVSTEAIGNSNTLLKIKKEGLVQQLASDLNDEKSIPFFRSLVSKFTDHEDTIYKCLSLTRETQELAGIKKSRGAVFTDHIKREAEKLGINI